jgi:hypothetical protein
VQNTDGTPRFSGETGTAPCGAAFVACAPYGTEDNNVLVVTPRMSDGTAAPAADPVPLLRVRDRVAVGLRPSVASGA